jgi:hypothetical protein
MSLREFQDWQRFEDNNRHPLPDYLLDAQASQICAVLVNVMSSRDQPISPTEFVVSGRKAAAPQEGMTDIDEIGAALDAMQGR